MLNIEFELTEDQAKALRMALRQIAGDHPDMLPSWFQVAGDDLQTPARYALSMMPRTNAALRFVKR